jgi:uncharacterized protein (TIGR02145 family)
MMTKKINIVATVTLLLFFVISKAQVTDKRTKVYKTIKIANQVWLAENLNVSTYQNGDSIPQMQDAREWENASVGAWCYFENKTENGIKVGKLYNWLAVTDPRGIAPSGWHIPTDIEWKELIDSLGGEEKAGALMKSISGWKNQDYDIIKCGFEAMQSGSRDSDGKFISGTANWWSANESNSFNAIFIFLNDFIDSASKSNYDKLTGFSIRCIKD